MPPIAPDVSGDPEAGGRSAAAAPAMTAYQAGGRGARDGHRLREVRLGVADDNFWGLYQTPRYAYMGGTSMAARSSPAGPPLSASTTSTSAGSSRARRSSRPRSSTVRSGSAATTRSPTTPLRPNYHQGFGGVDLTAIPNAAARLRLELADTWQTPEQFGRTGQRKRFTVAVSAVQLAPFRLCPGLASRICPAASTAERHQRTLCRPPRGTKHVGNAGPAPTGCSQISDCTNNVKVVRLDSPPQPGNFLDPGLRSQPACTDHRTSLWSSPARSASPLRRAPG